MSSVENGLFSRFLFYYLDKKTEWIDVLDEGDGEPLDEFFEKLGKEYLTFFHTLQKLSEIKFQMTPEQGVAFNKHFALLQADYEGLFGDDTVASVRRLATSTYRIAMILSALRIWEDGDTDSPRVCSDEDFQTAMAISEVLQQHMLRVIKELPLNLEDRNWPGQGAPAVEGILGRSPERIRSEGLQGHSPGGGSVYTNRRTIHPAMGGHSPLQSLSRTIPKAVNTLQPR